MSALLVFTTGFCCDYWAAPSPLRSPERCWCCSAVDLARACAEGGIEEMLYPAESDAKLLKPILEGPALPFGAKGCPLRAVVSWFTTAAWSLTMGRLG